MKTLKERISASEKYISIKDELLDFIGFEFAGGHLIKRKKPTDNNAPIATFSVIEPSDTATSEDDYQMTKYI